MLELFLKFVRRISDNKLIFVPLFSSFICLGCFVILKLLFYFSNYFRKYSFHNLMRTIQSRKWVHKFKIDLNIPSYISMQVDVKNLSFFVWIVEIIHFQIWVESKVRVQIIIDVFCKENDFSCSKISRHTDFEVDRLTLRLEKD